MFQFKYNPIRSLIYWKRFRPATTNNGGGAGRKLIARLFKNLTFYPILHFNVGNAGKMYRKYFE